MKNILLIDDNESIVETLALMIGGGSNDWNVLTAHNGKEGVDVLDSVPVDFIITDLQMPVMDGFGFIEYKNRNYPQTPLFAMTGEYTPSVEDKLNALGVSHCMEKPFDFDEVIRKIGRILRVDRAEEKLSADQDAHR